MRRDQGTCRPDGVLYLTDQRLIFEQKEEVATRKILFITTAKKKIQEMEWALPISLLETVQVRKMGMLKNEDYLDLHLRQQLTAKRFIYTSGKRLKHGERCSIRLRHRVLMPAASVLLLQPRRLPHRRTFQQYVQAVGRNYLRRSCAGNKRLLASIVATLCAYSSVDEVRKLRSCLLA